MSIQLSFKADGSIAMNLTPESINSLSEETFLKLRRMATGEQVRKQAPPMKAKPAALQQPPMLSYNPYARHTYIPQQFYAAQPFSTQAPPLQAPVLVQPPMLVQQTSVTTPVASPIETPQEPKPESPQRTRKPLVPEIDVPGENSPSSSSNKRKADELSEWSTEETAQKKPTLERANIKTINAARVCTINTPAGSFLFYIGEQGIIYVQWNYFLTLRGMDATRSRMRPSLANSVRIQHLNNRPVIAVPIDDLEILLDRLIAGERESISFREDYIRDSQLIYVKDMLKSCRETALAFKPLE